jgi:hypothetical protein
MVICGRHSTFFRFFIRILITMDFSSPLGLCISHLSELEHEMSVSFECGWVQSGQMASPHLTAEAVYLCTGNPMPKDIEQIAFWLLNESFSTSYQSILLFTFQRDLTLLSPSLFSLQNTRHHNTSDYLSWITWPAMLNMTVSCQEYFPALHSRLLSTMQVYALTCCAEISEMKTRKGLALFDVVQELQP